MKKLNHIIAISFIILSGCVPQSQNLTNPELDPFEELNRGIFSFNQTIDSAIIKPISQAYRTITPKPINKCISHVFLNLKELTTIANDILQLRLTYTLEDSWRFIINTTIGLGGCFDAAEKFDLPRRNQSFNNTVKTWGLQPGSYLVLPFLGSSSTTDIFFAPAEYYYLNPIMYLNKGKTTITALKVIDKRAQLLALDSALENAFDPYIFYRNAYFQSKAKSYESIQKNNTE